MTLVTSASLYNYVRAESTTEIGLMDTFVTGAIGLIETLTQRPINATLKTFIDEGAPGAKCLLVPQYPVSGNVVITDVEGTTVDSTTYTVYGNEGRILADEGVYFSNGPYTITAYVGWSLATDYSSRIEPILNLAILDIAADLYSRRQPMASAESAAETSVSYLGVELAPRTAGMLKPLMPVPITR